MLYLIRAVLVPVLLMLVFLGAMLGAIIYPSWLALVFGSAAGFFAADTLGRLNDLLYLASFDYIPERLAMYYGRSFCGRQVCIAAAREFGGRTRRVYHTAGYRWWHVLPDGFPVIITKRLFWRNVLLGHRHF